MLAELLAKASSFSTGSRAGHVAEQGGALGTANGNISPQDTKREGLAL